MFNTNTYQNNAKLVLFLGVCSSMNCHIFDSVSQRLINSSYNLGFHFASVYSTRTCGLQNERECKAPVMLKTKRGALKLCRWESRAVSRLSLIPLRASLYYGGKYYVVYNQVLLTIHSLPLVCDVGFCIFPHLFIYSDLKQLPYLF
jgi:hypothetical protein